MEFFLTHQVVKPVGIHTGGVYHCPGSQVALTGMEDPALPLTLQAVDLCVKGELHPVFGGAFRHAQSQLEGAHDAGSLRQQGAFHLFRKVGLQSPSLLPGEQLHAGNAVFHAPVIQLLELRQLLFGKTYHKGSHPLEGDVQLF